MDAEAQAALRRAGLDVRTIQRDESDTFRFFKAGAAAPFMCMHDPPLFKRLGWRDEPHRARRRPPGVRRGGGR